MTAIPKPKRRSKAQLEVLRLCREFLDRPTAYATVERLCASIAAFDLDARIKRITHSDAVESGERAEAKDLELCRDCRVKLDGSNRSGASGYQCVGCKKKYQREYMAKQRAEQKAKQLVSPVT